MVKKFGVLIALCALYAHCPIGYAAEIPSLQAKSAIVIEASTGRVIYALDAEAKRYPASTTKMMTLIVALERGNLDDAVTASENASSTEGSSIWLESGEQLKLSELLYAMMLVSGNDATVAVAEHVAGSMDAFAELMTQKAREIGADHTRFVNSSGLPDPNHYSTAHDLAKIAAYGYKNPMFAEIVGTKEKTIPWVGHPEGRELSNENWLLWIYEGGNGVKTGYTVDAGRCLVSGAKRDGTQLICVVLDSDVMWNDSIALLNYGFSQIESVNFLHKDTALRSVEVTDGLKNSVNLILEDDIDIPVVLNDKDKFHAVIDAPDTVRAEVAKGQKIGTLRVFYEDTEVMSADLVADETVQRRSFFAMMRQLFFSSIDYIRNKF